MRRNRRSRDNIINDDLISVVIPVFDEEESILDCYRELSDVLRNAGRDYEVIFVNDGSRDATAERPRRPTP